MLCVPCWNPPDGSGRPAQGTNPHKHKTGWEVCTKRAWTPHQKHASARGDTVNTRRGGGDITGSGYSCADKTEDVPSID